MTNTMTLTKMNFDNFETLTDADLDIAVGGKSGAYYAGYYTGKAVIAGATIAATIVLFL